jgi:ApaG protein
MVSCTEVTQGIKVTVQTTYESELSNPANRHFIFSYHITIENQNPFTVQLLRRYWLIKDSLSFPREVEGEGVVGKQPVLDPMDVHEYESACNLTSDFGSMSGNYLFVREDTGDHFRVTIPEFTLTTNDRLN